MHRIALALVTSLVLAAAGCGGDDEGGGGGGGGGGEQAGAAGVFSQNCGNCHTLAAADAEGQVGPNLDELKPDAAQVKEAIEQGPSVMPEKILEGAEADEVAQYVADNAGK